MRTGTGPQPGAWGPLYEQVDNYCPSLLVAATHVRRHFRHFKIKWRDKGTMEDHITHKTSHYNMMTLLSSLLLCVCPGQEVPIRTLHSLHFPSCPSSLGVGAPSGLV